MNLDEGARLAAIRRYDILDTPPDGAFDRIANLAARMFNAPIATVAIVDEDRIWFKAKAGLEVDQIDREDGLCSSAILRDGPYVVGDAAVDPRTINNSLVAGEFGLRFYAAAPLVTSDGHRLGTINVMDKEPRNPSEGQLEVLEDLAAIVIDEMELRLAARKGLDAQREMERLGEALQRSALPPVLPEVPGLQVAAWHQPARGDLRISGDFYDLFQNGDGAWSAVIGDVCGKGASAAVLMGTVRTQFTILARYSLSPCGLLEELNGALMELELSGKFCTICTLRIRPVDGRALVTVCCAGHPAPLIRRSSGVVETVRCKGQILGSFHKPDLSDAEFTLESGDVLVLYTDGVTELRGVQPSDTGERLLHNALQSASGEDASAILDDIKSQLDHPAAKDEDDRAILLFRVP